MRQPGEIALPTRVALHTGEAELRDGDYLGPALNRAARLRSLSRGGQILLSRATAELVADQLPEGAGLVDVGSHLLKGLSRPENDFAAAHFEAAVRAHERMGASLLERSRGQRVRSRSWRTGGS